MRLRPLLLATTLLGVFAATPTFAASLNLGIVGDATVGPTFINFGNYPLGTVYTPAPGYGIMEVGQPPTGLFATAGVTAGEFGQIQSLDATSTLPGSTLTPDPTTAAAFMTFDTGGSNLKIFLTELLPGTVGPFSLLDSPNGAVASFDINGFVYDTTDKSRTDITGTFAATFNGMTVADLLSEEAGGKDIATPFTATFSLTTTPEPGSLLLLGAGLLGMGLVSRRKRS
jgi:hypothetical protein